MTNRDTSTPSGFRLAGFKPAIFEAMKNYKMAYLSKDISAGFTVGMVALPLAMAIGIAAGVKPEQGLYAAIISGLIIALLGGSRVQIGGPEGAFVVVMYAVIAHYGLPGLLVATLGAGCVLFLLGLFRLGAFIQFIPLSIMVGFTNGIAVIIALQQVKDFLGLQIAKMPADFLGMLGAIEKSIGTINWASCAIAVASFLLMFFWPKLDRSKVGSFKRKVAYVPPTLVVLCLSTLAVQYGSLPVETIGDRFGGIPSSLPSLHFPSFSLSDLHGLVGPILTLAALGAIESLLCARVSDGMIHHRHNPNQELMAQGISNMVIPLFGAIPATGCIARTVTNIKAGAVSPISGIVHALTLLAVILVAAPLAKNIPLSALAAILMVVAFNMGHWRAFKHLREMTLSYQVTLLSTFVLTIVFDLTVAVEVGLGIAALFFLIRMSRLTQVQPMAWIQDDDAVSAWRFRGVLFFGSIGRLEEFMRRANWTPENPARVVVLDFEPLLHIDHTAMTQLMNVVELLRSQGREVVIYGADDKAFEQLEQGGFAKKMGPNFVANLIEAQKRVNAILKRD